MSAVRKKKVLIYVYTSPRVDVNYYNDLLVEKLRQHYLVDKYTPPLTQKKPFRPSVIELFSRKGLATLSALPVGLAIVLRRSAAEKSDLKEKLRGILQIADFISKFGKESKNLILVGVRMKPCVWLGHYVRDQVGGTVVSMQHGDYYSDLRSIKSDPEPYCTHLILWNEASKLARLKAFPQAGPEIVIGGSLKVIRRCRPAREIPKRWLWLDTISSEFGEDDACTYARTCAMVKKVLFELDCKEYEQVIRLHPLAKARDHLKIRRHLASEGGSAILDSEELIAAEKYAFAVTWNSNAAIDTILAGLPTFCFAQDSHLAFIRGFPGAFESQDELLEIVECAVGSVEGRKEFALKQKNALTAHIGSQSSFMRAVFQCVGG